MMIAGIVTPVRKKYLKMRLDRVMVVSSYNSCITKLLRLWLYED